jgi:hypothetical protein
MNQVAIVYTSAQSDVATPKNETLIAKNRQLPALKLSNCIKFMQSHHEYRLQTTWDTLFEPVSATVAT